MKSVGIFEAKIRFSGICDEIAKSGIPMAVSRRGQPLVVISPVPTEILSGREDIITEVARWQAVAGNDGDDFPDVWEERTGSRYRKPGQMSGNASPR